MVILSNISDRILLTNRTFLFLSTIAVRECDRIFNRTVAARYTIVGVADGIITRTGTATILVDLAVLAGWCY